MQQGADRFHTACSIFLLCLATTGPLRAQIVPDATLPVNSAVTPNGTTSAIAGGTAAGGNLFHSFKEFSVKTGTTAHFTSAPEIINILARVTGLTVSNIDGIISADGKANLFLINPNGIIFGPNARLNIGGSFIGSTASSIQLSDGSFYSAASPQAPPLLTVSVPAGLQFGPNPGAIRVRGAGHTLSVADPFFSPIDRSAASNSGLRVSPGNTLALVGGDIAIEGGVLTAEGGRIELGSVGGGAVSLSSSAGVPALGYSGVQSFRDIRLSQQALADASGTNTGGGAGGGAVAVAARRIEVRDGSAILIQNQGSQASGSITVSASESLELAGTTPDGRIRSILLNENLGLGKGGDIAVSSRRLVLEGGAQIATKTFTSAAGGNITALASEEVQLMGFSPVNPVLNSLISAGTLSSGTAGNIAISAGRLRAAGGGTVVSGTFGTGAGGNVKIQAADSVEVTGVIPFILTPSLLGSASLGQGNAGSVTLDTSRLTVRDGGRVDSSTVGSGSSGSLAINASQFVEVSGSVPGSRNPSQVISSANLADPILQQTFRLPAAPSGASGDVRLNTPVLIVRDGAQVTVKNDGSGNAGTLRVSANSIFLDTEAGITASTASGSGGNINLQVRDALLLRHGSSISATAGGTGNGGNLTIDAPVIAALENSDISANAFQGAGGNIQISTSGIFGTQYRVAPTAESDITASSEFGVSGTVTISNPEVDPSSGLVELPANLTDPAGQIVTGCAADRGNRFSVSGRGGLPEDPSQTLRGATLWSDVRPVRTSFASVVERRISSYSGENYQSPIVEATGWAIDERGRVRLVANSPDVTLQEGWQKSGRCGGGKTAKTP
ncbi:beta strand repeat-containing protein [Kamptonema formosum]|uniref:beta strand repeat-containing protein n=1 Tax=Kamptonema formosum TaxID=331992 RepID=UPI00034BC9B8|nr:S-layer family protein [Oscillatoria sp. PCC 10802]